MKIINKTGEQVSDNQVGDFVFVNEEEDFEVVLVNSEYRNAVNLAKKIFQGKTQSLYGELHLTSTHGKELSVNDGMRLGLESLKKSLHKR